MDARNTSRLAGQAFDVLICGGGVYGAWTAYDAALRGLRVAIVDQGDWAGATSSASSKLVHGGLRYLENFDFKLVRKTLAERQMLMAAGPHRVRPLRFGVPVYKGGRIGGFRLAVGLTLYDGLAESVGETESFQRFRAAEFARRFPCLRGQGLEAGFTYLDAQTDDARLVLELIDGAERAGAVCLNYCRVTGLNERNGKAVSADVCDQVGGECFTVAAKQFVNAAGQWGRALAPRCDFRLSKGVHLILPKCLDNEALLLTAKADGRVFFMIPWYDKTLVGTTDTDYRGNVDRVCVERADVDYLLGAVNHFVNGKIWTQDDVIGAFAGLRVLQSSGQKSPSAVSRDWELREERNGLLTSVGGKLTSARSDAAHIVDRLCANLGSSARCATFGRPLPWAPAGDFKAWSKTMAEEALALGIDPISAEWLLFRHGKRASEIFTLCRERPESARRIVPEAPFIVADLLFCARNEQVVHLDDLLRRRMPLLILAKLGEEELRRIVEELGWDGGRLAAELARL